MSIFITEPEVRINSTERTAALTWKLGAANDFDGDPCTAAARLFVMHDKDRKHFTASVQRVDLIDRGGYHVEKFSILGGPRVRLSSQAVPRYSAAAFKAFVDSALAELRSKVDEPDVERLADPATPA